MIKAFAFALMMVATSISLATAKEIRIAMGNFEPYYIEQGNTGIFSDIVTATFHEMENVEPLFIFGYSTNQQLMAYEAGRVDAIANVFENADVEGCRTDLAFIFSDVVVSKTSDSLQINSLSDIKGLSIVAFEGARIFFGKQYEEITSETDYTEVAKPNLQMRMLHAGRADVSVGDKYIFLNALKKSTIKNTKISDFVFHEIFPRIESRMAFTDTSICPKFNEALGKIKQNGVYEQIYQNYVFDLVN